MKLKLSIISTAVIAACSFTMNAQAYDGSKYIKDAKITMDQAQALALKAYPGTIVERELEHKKGGSGLRFSFDVRANQITHEVGIDAQTGEVLENRVESPNEAD